MKLEKLNLLPKKTEPLQWAFKNLKPGEQIRLTTAREGHLGHGLAYLVGKKLGFKLHTRIEGEDVIVYRKMDSK